MSGYGVATVAFFAVANFQAGIVQDPLQSKTHSGHPPALPDLVSEEPRFLFSRSALETPTRYEEERDATRSPGTL